MREGDVGIGGLGAGRVIDRLSGILDDLLTD